MRHTGGQCHSALFSEGHILSDAHVNLCAHQHGERGKVAACDVRARGHLWLIFFLNDLRIFIYFNQSPGPIISSSIPALPSTPPFVSLFIVYDL